MCMVLNDDIFECGFSHIFTSKGEGGCCIKLCISAYFFYKKFVKDVDYSSIQTTLFIVPPSLNF